jgi:hypothetical protein
MKAIRIGPEMFISPPYTKCPKCGKETFGVVGIYSQHYNRRCKACLFPRGNENFVSCPLPELNKKIIYIDQFALSNMMKALNPETKAYKNGTLDHFWLNLFERLDSLCKLQLIVCPHSDLHIDESLPSPYFNALKRMYLQLSHNVRFFPHEWIERRQVLQHAKNWILGKAEIELIIEKKSAIHNKINGWQNRYIIDTNIKYFPEMIDHLRSVRDETYDYLQELFTQWKNSAHVTFDEWFETECRGYGESIINAIRSAFTEHLKISFGLKVPTLNDLLPSEAYMTFHSIQNIFIEHGISENDSIIKTFEYLMSATLKQIPFVRISAMLWATIARKAASGMKKPPDRGMANDIKMVSVLLPYCDAMFIDKRCHSYIKESHLCEKYGYDTNAFSLTTKDEFLDYLNEIETNAPREIIDAVEEVYGSEWKNPYLTMYKTKIS